MATKKVEEKKVKGREKTSKKIQNNKVKDKNINNAKDKVIKEEKNDTKKNLKKESKKIDNKDKVNKTKVKEVEEEKVVCEECGKKYLASLNECPKCGYAPIEDVKQKSFYDDEDEDDGEFDDYDDEDEEVVVSKKENQKRSELVVEEESLETGKKSKKEIKSTSEEDKPKKNNKNEKDKIKQVSNKSVLMEQNEDFINFIKILVVIVLLVVVVYLVAAFLNKEFESEKEDNGEDEVTASIQNEKILASSIFDKPDKEYYVLVYDGSDVWADYYSLVYSSYSSIENEDKLPLFWVDLSDLLNKSVIAESSDEVNEKAKKYSDLKMESPTLVHIKNGKNVGYYDDDDAVDELSKIIDSLIEE